MKGEQWSTESGVEGLGFVEVLCSTAQASERTTVHSSNKTRRRDATPITSWVNAGSRNFFAEIVFRLNKLLRGAVDGGVSLPGGVESSPLFSFSRKKALS